MLPQQLFKVVKVIFGASRRALPLTAIVGCTIGIISFEQLTFTAHGSFEIISSQFNFDLEALPRVLFVLRFCVTLVDGLVLFHGALIGAHSMRVYLCGPKGKVKCCRANSEELHYRRVVSCPRLTANFIGGAIWCLLSGVRAAGRGALAVTLAVLLWISFVLLVSVITALCFLLVMVRGSPMKSSLCSENRRFIINNTYCICVLLLFNQVLAVNTLCDNLEAGQAFAFRSIEIGADNVRDAFEDTGIIDILGSVETQATETFWFLPIDLGLADAVDTTFELRLESAELLSQNKTRQFVESLEEVCDPFDGVFEKLRLCVILALLALAGQIIVLVSHHTQYTAWFYEVRLAHAESEAAGYERRVKLTADYRDAKARATAHNNGLPMEAVPVLTNPQAAASPQSSKTKKGGAESITGKSKEVKGSKKELPAVKVSPPPSSSLVRVVYAEPETKSPKKTPPQKIAKQGSTDSEKPEKKGTAVAAL